MVCQLGKFEGTWKVIRGSNRDSSYTVEKKNDSRYKLKEDGSVLHDDLVFDNVACTLKNNSVCLSLFQDCEHLFGIEQTSQNPNSFEVWGTKRTGEGSSESGELSPELLDWRLDDDWILKARIGGPPFHCDDKITIRERAVGVSPYGICANGISHDDLWPNEDNRTLDSSMRRTVAYWRQDDQPKSFIFGMVIVSAALLEKVEDLPDPSNIDDVKKALQEAGGYLPFEIEMLASDLVGPTETSIGVWGAEEG